MEVASVSTNFDFDASALASTSLPESEGKIYSFSAGVGYTERPTITYTPLQGDQFVTQLMSPVDLDTILLLYHSGWSIERIFRVCLQSINGVKNAPSASSPTPDHVPEYEEFREVVKLLRELQLRRVLDMVQQEELKSISQLQVNVLHDAYFAQRFVRHVSVGYTEMFRDPEVFVLLRRGVLTFLATYPFLRIWDVGVASGEELYSLAVMLLEEHLYNRSLIYATDINSELLQKARKGIYHVGKMQQYTRNYISAGGKEDFSKYYTARFENVIFNDSLKKNITFARHNLVTDSAFNLFNLIICRNVMIYFDEILTRKVHELLYKSLELYGFLVLGSRENLRFSPFADRYEAVDRNLSVYKKIA